MFRKILIANRGEIAVRITRTAQRLGIRVVAVYSQADATAVNVKMADEAVFIGPAAPVDSYLRIDKIIAAAKATGAEAIHPGYGFLSENADFVAALAQENITFIGPTAETIAAMGSKSAAKNLMEQAGVATVPGYQGTDQSAQAFKEAAARIGYPILLKATAGGGGKGMRLVEHESKLEDALISAQREAKSSFGDSSFLLERFLHRSRHVEVQLFGDGQGNVVHLFDRDCSVQRRHQKVLEEAPAPGLTPAIRTKLLQAGVAAGKAVNYRGAGTVEFLYDGAEAVYFMEMNTRLQVEHPVSEAITGIDFVEWQLRIAAGEGLPLAQEEIIESGHAFEARVYAEDPYNNFAPSTGKLTFLQLSDQARNDSGIEAGQRITPYYDPMISKIITQAATREQALVQMQSALEATHISGLKLNVQFLHAICIESDFALGNISTNFIEEHKTSLFSRPDFGIAPLIAAGLWQTHQIAAATTTETGAEPSPWSALVAWRMNQPAKQTIWVNDQGDYAQLTLTVNARQVQGVLATGASAAARKKGEPVPKETKFSCQLASLNNNRVEFDYEGVRYAGFVAPNHLGVRVWFGACCIDVEFVDIASTTSTQKVTQGSLIAPMSGVVVNLKGAVGDSVAMGEALLVMEAMKMEHTIVAPATGTIKKFPFMVGEQVQEGNLLVEFEANS